MKPVLQTSTNVRGAKTSAEDHAAAGSGVGWGKLISRRVRRWQYYLDILSITYIVKVKISTADLEVELKRR